MHENLKKILENIPKSPGIYKYYDKQNNIIYIGKSVNLSSRVNSYFNGKSKLNFAKRKMVDKIVNIETIVTSNETESLILETTLIKQHKPKYNILMKDDKNHIYIKITSEDFPKITKTRIKSKGGTYFGPYISTHYVNNILKVIKKHFGYGCYGEHFFKDGKSGYNLDKYIFKNNTSNDFQGKVLTADQIKNEYNNQLLSIKDFLKGNFREVIFSLKEKMKNHAENLNFEEAQKIKVQIESIHSLEETQNVRDKVSGNYNVVNFIEKFDNFYIGLIEIRDGKITGYNNYEVETKLEESKEEVLQKFIEIHYSQLLETGEKTTYLLPFNITDLINEINCEVPQIGPKKDLLQMTYKNIYEYAYKKHLAGLSTKGFTKKNMQNLLDLLGYKAVNKSIVFECNDISHFSGSHTVASRSVIENGKTNPSKYKKFKIKTLEDGKIDDFDSMREIMTRRVKEIDKTGILPDLIIIDGGKGQLSSVVEIVENYKKEAGDKVKELLNKLQLVSIAKREEELFLPGQSESILLKKESLELRMTQKIRDEAHRFAITFNRDKRIKAMKKNLLDSLPGFGPITRKKILNKYGSVENLKEVSKIDLLKIINTAQLETLSDHGLVQ